MSSKLNGFSEESSELQEQIGCITGIFQMFDRHKLLGGRKLNGHQNHKLTSGISLVDVINPGAENVAKSPRLIVEKNSSKNFSENQRMSLESSRTSFSSSSCSSFSSVDCNKSILQEPISFNQAIKNLANLKNLEIDAKIAHQSVDFQKVARDHTKREPFLSLKTSYKEEVNQPVSCRDSPRPMQLLKSMDGSYAIGVDGKSMVPLDLNETFRVLMKLKEAPWSSSEIMEPSFEAKEAPFNRASLDGRRLSYDGKDILSNSLNSHENVRILSKLKELPRLSLDSRESSMRSSNSLVKNLDDSRNKERSITSPNTQKEFRSPKSAPGVVAKLMGLESMPTSSSSLMETMGVMRSYAIKGSSVQRSNKLLSNSLHSKASTEPAPWKRKEKLHIPENSFSRRDNQLKQQPETVYSEIEKRLNELEFRHANKDLRALKQILDAMQAKGLLESKKNEDQSSPKPVCNNSDHQVSTRSAITRRTPLQPLTKGSNTTKTYESPIVVMKPAKSLNIFDGSATSIVPLHDLTRLPLLRTNDPMDKKKLPGSRLTRDSTQRTSPRINGKTEENGQSSRLRTELGSSKLQESSRNSNGGLEKSSSPVSPRLQQRNIEIERRLRSSVSSSNSSKHQKLSTDKQLAESVPPRNKLRLRSNRIQGNDAKETKETRNLIQQGDEIFQRSDSSMSSTSKLETIDISTRTDFSSSKQGVEGPSTYLHSPVAPEQPSPISVLAATFYQDDLPASEVMRSPNKSKGINFPDSVHSCEPHHISIYGINQKKLESIGNLLQKLKELNSTSDSTSNADHIASLCKTQIRDHWYISEILMASGLLMMDLSCAPFGLMPIQLHPSGHPINPDLFLVLEQTKDKQGSNFYAEKLHRRLLFDVVNEVLVQILEIKCSSSHRKLQGSVLTGQQLLKEMISEIDRIHAEPSKAEGSDDDSNVIGEKLLCQSIKWNDYGTGLPAVVLDIERAIFKDLIDEIVRGEASSLKQKCARRHPQLFGK